MHKSHRLFLLISVITLLFFSIRSYEGSALPTKTTLYDHVVTFPQGFSIFSIPATLEKNTIYSITLESYVPYADLQLDIYLRSADYHYFLWAENDTLDPITNPAFKTYFHFGVAFTANYTLEFRIITVPALNLHIQFVEETTLQEYYHSVELLPIKDNSSVMDIALYNSATPNHEYNANILNDTEMWINLFQVSPVAVEITNQPRITVTLQIETMTYTLIPDLDYEGYGLPSSKSFANISSHYYRMRFGSSISGIGHITISMANLIGNPVNFAFIWFHSTPIGDGPEIPISPPTNSTNQTTTTTTTPPTWTTNPPSPSLNDRIDASLNTAWLRISGFLNDHFYLLIGICVGVIGMVYVVRIYVTNKRPKFVKPEDPRTPR